MNLLDFIPRYIFKWLQNDNWLGNWLGSTPLVFPAFATVHTYGIAVLLGSLLIVDLRLLGFGMRRISAAQLAGYLNPWTHSAMAVMGITGIPMFISEAVKASAIDVVFYKMVLLVSALTFHFTLRRKAIASGASEGSGSVKLAAYLSLTLWWGVALAGRAIGFLYVLDPQ